MKQFIHDHADILQILGVGSGGFTAMMTNIDLILKGIIALATLGYIARKWYLMEKRK